MKKKILLISMPWPPVGLPSYKQPALIEEFISGEEFTVAIVGNDFIEIMPIVQVKLDGHLKLNDMFYSFDYLDSSRLQLICPAMIDKDIKREISKIALKTYRAVEYRDFGRVDIRVDRNARPYVLEINPLPCLSKYDVFRVVANEIGMYHEEMIRKILTTALERYKLT